MRLFGIFKIIEIYLILTGIFLIFSFDQLCEQKDEENLVEYWKMIQTKVDILRAAPIMNETAVRLPQDPETTKTPEIQQPKTAKTESSKPPMIKVEYMVDDAEIAAHRARHPAPKEFSVIPEKKSTIPTTSKKDSEDEIVPTPSKIPTMKRTVESQIELGHAETHIRDSQIPVTSEAAKSSVHEPFKEIHEEPFVKKLPSFHPDGIPLKQEYQDDDNLVDALKISESEIAKKRVKRETLDHKFDGGNETEYFDVFHCEKVDGTIFASVNPFDDEKNIYQQMFALRFWGLLLLCIHLVMVLYHLIYNCFHHSPSSQCLNSVFAVIGLVVWNLISIWISYQYFMWERIFVELVSPIIPSIPFEFFAFLIVTVTMDAVLLYELSTPMAYFVSYEVTSRHPNREYVPVSTDSNNNKNNSKINNVDGKSFRRTPQSPSIQSSRGGSLI